ncbi:MAG: hypothetical protein H8E26_06940 [FCB group bacterium]|nr:hypothetical protein [FCB group bacterium]MBL7029530.1 hypothetical protein [Candidatus Neomarinimicrobiota bacterium]MBL7121856.1 hypothetical protein [Candidatus Neomarinimicrobiota bacterium]
MKKTYPLLLISCCLAFSMILGSCTVYYNTSDIKKTFSQSQREINKTLGKIAKDRREKRGIYNQLIRKIPDSTAVPYPTLSVELIEMTRSFKQLKQTTNKLEQLKANLNRLVKGQKKIESGSLLWDKFQVIKNEFDTQSGNFESQVNDYNKSSNEFINLLNKHQITHLKVVEIKQQIDQYLKELNQSIELLSAELVKSGQDTQIDKKVLSQLEDILSNIRADQATLDALIRKFEEEVGSEPMIWSGPGMYSHSILKDMQEIGDKISAQGQAFNKLAANL